MYGSTETEAVILITGTPWISSGLWKGIWKNWRFSVVRGLEIQENLERGNMSEAIRVLQESKILDKEYPGLAAGYSEQLISIYEKP